MTDKEQENIEAADSLHLLALTFSANMKCKDCIVSISRVPEILFTVSLSSESSTFIRPCNEYSRHIRYAAFAIYLEMLGKIQTIICNFISPDMASCQKSPSHRRNVASLCFPIYFVFFYASTF